jgi:hypothetical protein
MRRKACQDHHGLASITGDVLYCVKSGELRAKVVFADAIELSGAVSNLLPCPAWKGFAYLIADRNAQE